MPNLILRISKPFDCLPQRIVAIDIIIVTLLLNCLMILDHHLLMQHDVFFHNILSQPLIEVLIEEQIAILDHVDFGVIIVSALWDVFLLDVE